jgi:hypothetical protein
MRDAFFRAAVRLPTEQAFEVEQMANVLCSSGKCPRPESAGPIASRFISFGKPTTSRALKR